MPASVAASRPQRSTSVTRKRAPVRPRLFCKSNSACNATWPASWAMRRSPPERFITASSTPVRETSMPRYRASNGCRAIRREDAAWWRNNRTAARARTGKARDALAEAPRSRQGGRRRRLCRALGSSGWRRNVSGRNVSGERRRPGRQGRRDGGRPRHGPASCSSFLDAVAARQEA